MSMLIDGKRREAIREAAIDEVYNSRPAQVVLDDKKDLYRWVANYLGNDVLLAYIEFGVASGESILFHSGQFTNPRATFVGFDSFQGLPEAWLHLPKFAFGRNGEPPTIGDERVRFVKGWFQNTIPPFLDRWEKPAGSVLVHYDADLYSSTLFALAATWSHIQDYYFMMDDFLSDDAIALCDFVTAFPVKVEFLAQAGRDGNGKALPSWVFGRMSRRKFDPSAAT